MSKKSLITGGSNTYQTAFTFATCHISNAIQNLPPGDEALEPVRVLLDVTYSVTGDPRVMQLNELDITWRSHQNQILSQLANLAFTPSDQRAEEFYPRHAYFLFRGALEFDALESNGLADTRLNSLIATESN